MKKLQFPSSFQFGVADADLQVIGEENTIREEGSEQTMWDHFAKTSGKCARNESPAEGIDRYHRWEEDIEIMKQLGVKQYRTSVSMARLLKRDGSINTKAVAWYKTYFKALQQAGITIYGTLYHWELPQFLNEKGGWTNRDTANWLVKHALFVYENLGEYIDEYFILNEPWVVTIRGYYLGVQAPGETNLSHALLAAHNHLLAQGLVFTELKKRNQNLKVSTVYNVMNYYAQTPNPQDIHAASFGYGHVNDWFLDPLFQGKYPEHMVALYGKHMPKITKEDMEIIRIGDKLNALGLNYYFSNIVRHTDANDLHFQTVIPKGTVTNGLGWPISVPPTYQEALYELLLQIHSKYKDWGLKKIYIAENGIAGDTTWDKKSKIIPDEMRMYYLQEHLQQVYKALLAGVPIEKYFLWTLMDNYEWQRGYGPDANFGIIHVDRKSMKRVMKKSALWYKKVLQTNSLMA